MLTLICAPTGYGKTRYLYDRIAEKLNSDCDSRMYVIVPEQESVKSEKALLEHFGNSLNERVEILNFSRLANRVFREAGGITYSYVDNGGKDLIAATVLEDAGEELPDFFKGVDDESFITSLRSEADLLRLGGITADDLVELSRSVDEKEEDSARLVGKMKQLATFTTLYEGAIKESGIDALDDLDRLSDTLDDYDFFDNTYVFIDGFYDFTYPEYRIIERMVHYSKGVWLTLPLVENDRENVFVRGSDARARLYELCERIEEGCETVYLTERVKKQSEPLTHLATSLIYGVGGRLEAGESVTLTACKTPFDECVHVAREIVRLVKNGVRFRDISVCSGSIADYGTMLEDVFEKYGIRYLKTNHDTLVSKPLVDFLFSALDAVQSGFYLPRVRRFLESSLIPLPRDRRFLLLNYVTAWNINSSLWHSESDWVMNPRGYVGALNGNDARELEEVNCARRVLAPILLRLEQGLKAKTVTEKVSAIWSFFEDCKVKETLVKRSDNLMNESEFTRARDEAAVWNLTVGALDKLTASIGDRAVGLDRFIKYMRIVFRDSAFGRIPSSLDEVEVGDVGFLRNGEVKHTFLMGFNEGSFPSSKVRNGVFTENERRVLERFNDYFKSDSQEMKLYNEVFDLLVAVSSPSDALHLVYHTSSQGSSDDRISFFLPMITSALEIYSDTYDPSSAFPVCREELCEWVIANRDADNIGEVLDSIRTNDSELADTLESRIAQKGFSSDALVFQKPEEVFSNRLSMSQSRLDTYSRCPFSFYSNYMLELRTHRRAEFKAAESGSLVHKVLEEVIARIMSNGRGFKGTDSEEVKALALESAENHLKLTAPEISDKSKRFAYLIKRLTSFVLYVIENMREEFENSDFEPKLFEEKMEEGGKIPPYSVTLPDGSSLVFGGCVDRVDCYEENGHTYLRVVDYKTKIGGKKFDLNDVINGINLQLLVYLFAVWQKGGELETSPAGIMYMPASRPMVKLATADGVEEEKELRDDNMKRSGLFLLDEEVLEAMEHGLEGRVIPVKRKKDGELSAQATLATLEQFGALKRYTDKVFIRLAEKLKGGHVEAEPLCSSSIDSCKWCDFKAFCRYEGEGREYIKHKSPWTEIEEN